MSIKKAKEINTISGKAIFFFALTKRWGTKERFIINDCLHAKEAGARVYLYCYKKSYIEQIAKLNGIETLYHRGKVYTKVLQWHKLRGISKTLKDLKISIVHCYDVSLLWPLTYFLRSMPLVPLVFTQETELEKFYRDFYFRPLIARIDQVFVPMTQLLDNVLGHLNFPLRKMKLIGMGVTQKKIERPKSLPFSFEGTRFCIGTNLNGIETNTKFLDTLFHSLNVLVKKGVGPKGITLILFCERPWNEFHLTDELKRKLTDLGLEENVAFATSDNLAENQSLVDLWVSLVRRETLEDYAIQAIVNGVPVLLPRTALAVDLVSDFGRIGETYRSHDSRELREKLAKILLNLDTYKKNIEKAKAPLLDTHGRDAYRKMLVNQYAKLIEKRERLARKKENMRKAPKNLNNP